MPLPRSGTPTEKALFFTLPVALNYQRNSYVLWVAVAETWKSPATRWIFDPAEVSNRTPDDVAKSSAMARSPYNRTATATSGSVSPDI